MQHRKMSVFMLFHLLLLLIIVSYSHGKQLPSFIKRCKHTTVGNEIGNCVKKTYNDNKDKFIAGVPEMHIPPLDPFIVDRVVFETGNGTAISVHAVFRNVNVQGNRNTVLESLDFDIENCKVIVETRLAKLRITSDYTMNGRIMIIPINGYGPVDGNFTDVHTLSHFSGKHVTRKGKQYIDWTDHKIEMTIGNASLHFDNLINGNKELSDATNQIFNENSAEVIKEMKPLVEDTMTSIIFSIIKRVYHDYSIDELFETE